MLKSLCAAALSVAMSINVFSQAPATVPADNSNTGIESVTMEDGVSPKAGAAEGVMRRPLSPEQPMYIIHIDSWNYADPAKIIDLIPEDLLPYVVFNISLSINWDPAEKRFIRVHDGYETAKSWLRTCAEKNVWTMIQPASGGYCHFPDYIESDYDLEDTIFAEFFRDYPNFIGYNYCEQFWGFYDENKPDEFQNPNFPDSKWVLCEERYKHFANLLKLCNKYGGYLDISWCANEWSPPLNPIAMLKKVPEWEQACRLYSENYILEEKYTQTSYIADVESLVYGQYIAGYCGNFGVRYDDSGWSDSTWDGTGNPTKDEYRMATAIPIHIERMALNGCTVIDGPELVWADDFMELDPSIDSEGYKSREWAMYDQFQNDMLDLFRKVLDKTIRIPTREEVIDRTKVAIIQDVETASSKFDYPDGEFRDYAFEHDAFYSTYPNLFEGLYRKENDGNLRKNRDLFKRTGRYPTIPTVKELLDDTAKSIDVQISQTSIDTRWPTIQAKQDEFNSLFAEEYWGNFYAARNENTWVTYNNNKNGAASGGYFIPKYNTCKQVELTYSEYASGLINEYEDRIDFYLNNYDEENPTELKTNTIKIYGATSKPSFTCKRRGIIKVRSTVTEDWSNGVYTLTVEHNGPIDITVNCSGSETDRLTEYKTATLTAPASPAVYTGARQYEGEFFDSKNIEGILKNGCDDKTITKYWGQGYLKFGTRADAAVRDTVVNDKAEKVNMKLRYAVLEDINNVDLYVNGSKITTLSLPKGESYSDWKTVTQEINLVEGDNKIELKANSELAGSLYIDNFVIE